MKELIITTIISIPVLVLAVFGLATIILIFWILVDDKDLPYDDPWNKEQ